MAPDSCSRVLMEVGTDGVAIITLSNPPVNAISIPIIADLKEKYNEAIKRNDVIAIVLIGEGEKFSSGLDLTILQQVQKTGDTSLIPDLSIDVLVNKVEDGTKPSVAAIQEFAFGGAFEIAMACHARICTPKTQLALPELSLGIIPGAGGTQRLPRLVGVKKAVDMLLSSKPISSEEGKNLGVVDAIVRPHELLKVSRLWALDIAKKRKPWIRSLHFTDKLGSLSEMHNFMMIAKQEAKKTARNLPQDLAVLDVIEEGIIHGGHNVLLKEDRVFKELLLADTCRGLVHIFFAQRTTFKIPGVTDVGLKPRHMRKAGVIGGGLMGSGIATVLLLSNLHVVLKEVNFEVLSKAIEAIEGNIKGLVMNRKLAQNKAEIALSLLKGVVDYSEFKDVDMVIEAVSNSIKLKQTVISELEKSCSPNCILATSTSTIDLNAIGEMTNSKERLVGAHFFSPAHIMPLIEIVRTKNTSAQVILDLMTLAKTLKKVPVVVHNCIGFAVNRTFFPYTQSAHLLVNLGVDLFRIDHVVKDFGLPVGPFELQDSIGFEAVLAGEKHIASAFPDRSFRSPLVELLVKRGRYGKSNGKGFYTYRKGGKAKPDPSVIPIMEEFRQLNSIMPRAKAVSVSDQELIEMILFPVVNEACCVLEEGVAVRASDLGMSFPSYRGGIVFWADRVGPSYIYQRLKKWETYYGSFFRPSRFLKDQVAKGLSLSQQEASTLSASRSRL